MVLQLLGDHEGWVHARSRGLELRLRKPPGTHPVDTDDTWTLQILEP